MNVGGRFPRHIIQTIFGLTNMKDELTEGIIGAAIEVHRILGPGLLESIYEEALCHELTLREIRCQRQVESDVVYKNKIIKGQKLDLLVNSEVVVELKAVSKLPEVGLAHPVDRKVNCLINPFFIRTLGDLCDLGGRDLATEYTEHTEFYGNPLMSVAVLQGKSLKGLWVKQHER